MAMWTQLHTQECHWVQFRGFPPGTKHRSKAAKHMQTQTNLSQFTGSTAQNLQLLVSFGPLIPSSVQL
jgi:hypothetical protein